MRLISPPLRGIPFALAAVALGVPASPSWAQGPACNAVCVGKLQGHVAAAEVQRQCCAMAAPTAAMARIPLSNQCVAPAKTCTLYVPQARGQRCSCALPSGAQMGMVR